MQFGELASRIPRWPNGHVNNQVADRLAEISRDGPETRSQHDLRELNGLVARAHFLIAHPPKDGGNLPPDGGSAAPMALAA